MSWPSVSVCLAFGAFCSVWYSSMEFYIVYDQELVWSVAFFVGVCQSLGHLLAFVKCLVRSVAFAEIMWLWEPWGWHCPQVFLVSTCVVVPCACSVFVALLAWRFSAFPPYPPSFQHFFFLSTEPSGLSVMGARRGPGVGGLWLGCELGRPVGCSSTLGIWLRLQPRGFIGTFPPLATCVLKSK